jgi:Tol biopolymer transport system component
VAISSNGHVLAWVGATETSTQLWSRHLDEGEAHPVNGTEGAQAPFFSPDGEWLGFWADGKLKKVAVRGGAPQTICETEHVHGPSWGDGVIVMSAVGDGSLFSVDPGGGKPQAIRIPNGTGFYAGDFPRLVPGSRSFLASSLTDHTVDMVSLDTEEITVLVNGGSDASYLPSGHLVWSQDASLLAAPFDLARRTITGEAQTVIDGVLSESHLGDVSHYAVSDEGTLVYLPGESHRTGSSPVWVRLDGTTQPMPIPIDSYFSPRISPDGRRILLSRRTGTPTLWLAEPDRGLIGPVTGDEGHDWWAVWTPDGAHVIYNSQRGNLPSNLWMQPVDRNAPPTPLTTTTNSHQPAADITQDGRTVIFVSATLANTDLDIYLLHIGTEAAPVPLLDSGANEVHAALSPDETWLAYASDVTGRFEVCIQRFPSLGGTMRVSSNGGQEPKWSPSGDRIYFRSTDGRRVFAVDVVGDDPLQFSQERLLFEGSFDPGPRWGSKWDIHPDGDRFLMLQIELSENPREIQVVTNWFAELERLVPSGD